MVALEGGPALVTDHVGEHGLLGYAYRALVAELARRTGPDPATDALAREEYSTAQDGRPATRVSIPLGP
jgi:hypothetical protein